MNYKLIDRDRGYKFIQVYWKSNRKTTNQKTESLSNYFERDIILPVTYMWKAQSHKNLKRVINRTTFRLSWFLCSNICKTIVNVTSISSLCAFVCVNISSYLANCLLSSFLLLLFLLFSFSCSISSSLSFVFLILIIILSKKQTQVQHNLEKETRRKIKVQQQNGNKYGIVSLKISGFLYLYININCAFEYNNT